MLKCKNINKYYSNLITNERQTVLSDINLTIKQGDIVALKGPSGSGKSTLLNIMSGLDVPSSGEVLFQDKMITKFNSNKMTEYRNKNIGIIFQFFNLLPDFNVQENILMPLFISGQRDVPSRLYHILDELNLSHKINSPVNTLSGGEAQRVAIARAIINEPDIILADEPTGNLDKVNSNDVINLLISTCKNINTSLFLVTHDNNILDKFDIILTLDSGNIETN
ncbi:MAG: hypothetical protein CMD65_02665 [Gammaproteobacteria bacterium]|nr:hypothetical protein [Gammaproteobacteria bacterium]|tara:strand:+ start:252 stop:920 length:669 start_codon:yes stop_codon:yes gene_type:complete